MIRLSSAKTAEEHGFVDDQVAEGDVADVVTDTQEMARSPDRDGGAAPADDLRGADERGFEGRCA